MNVDERGYKRPTIREILADPGYREFAAACTEMGRCILPDAFPWHYMGKTDVEFACLEMRYESGVVVPPKEKAAQVALVRQMESQVVEWWSWWLGWEYLSRGKSQAGARESPAAKPATGLLF